MKKLKNIFPTLVVFVVTFALTAIFCQYSLIRVKDHSLFLFTADYFTEAFAMKASVWQIVKSFVAQFLDIKVVGPALVALIVTLLFLILRVPFRKSAAAIWSLAASFIVAAVVLTFMPSTRSYEHLSKTQILARDYKWDKVLAAANPKRCENDGAYRPYAALALASKGQLLQYCHYYSINKPSDMDMETSLSMDGLFFGSLMYDAFGSPDEAIHRTFQAADHLDHGTSFETLYMLIRYNIELGNYTMVRKYAGILGRSPRHYFLSRKLLRMYAGKSDVKTYAPSFPVTDNPIYNAAKIKTASGETTMAAAQYFRTYQMLSSVD